MCSENEGTIEKRSRFAILLGPIFLIPYTQRSSMVLNRQSIFYVSTGTKREKKILVMCFCPKMESMLEEDDACGILHLGKAQCGLTTLLVSIPFPQRYPARLRVFMTSLTIPPVIHLTYERQKRHTDESFWWSSNSASSSQNSDSPSATDISSQASGANTNTQPVLTTSPPTIPSSNEQPQPSGSQPTMSNSLPIPTQSSTLGSSFSNSDTTFLVTSSVPITVTEPSTTFTSLSQTVFTSTRVASAFPEAQSITSSLQVRPVCIGDGVDGLSVGLLSTVIIPTAIGVALWVRLASFEPACKLTLPSYYLPLLDLIFAKCMGCVNGSSNKGV